MNRHDDVRRIRRLWVRRIAAAMLVAIVPVACDLGAEEPDDALRWGDLGPIELDGGFELDGGADTGGLEPLDPTFGPVDPTFGPVDPTFGPVDPTFGPMDPTFGPEDEGGSESEDGGEDGGAGIGGVCYESFKVDASGKAGADSSSVFRETALLQAMNDAFDGLVDEVHSACPDECDEPEADLPDNPAIEAKANGFKVEDLAKCAKDEGKWFCPYEMSETLDVLCKGAGVLGPF